VDDSVETAREGGNPEIAPQRVCLDNVIYRRGITQCWGQKKDTGKKYWERGRDGKGGRRLCSGVKVGENVKSAKGKNRNKVQGEGLKEELKEYVPPCSTKRKSGHSREKFRNGVKSPRLVREIGKKREKSQISHYV